MSMNRRKFLQGTGAALGLSLAGAPAIAQSRTKIRVGYLHTLAVDGQMWLAQHLGAWGKHGLEPEFGELRSHVRELVMKEYAAQSRLTHPEEKT